MLLREETYKIQSALASYCRTGTEIELPGTTPGRLQNYRRLVYNIVEDILQSAFPITYDLLGDEVWNELVHDFFSTHKCQTSQVMVLAAELHEYVRDNPLPIKEEHPYLTDLLWFEWIEMEIYLMPDQEIPKIKTTGNWLTDHIVLNPESTLIALQYPVHRITGTELAQHQGNYFLLTFRDPDTGTVHFFELSVFYAFVIEQLNKQQISLQQILAQACGVFNIKLNQEIEKGTISLLQELQQKKFVHGFLA